MNYKMVLYLIGQLLRVEGLLMFLPLICAAAFRESTMVAFLVPAVVLIAFGSVLTFRMPEKREIYAKEGFAIVGLSWILLSVFGALPFMLSGSIPHFVDALFETASGLSTTGATILRDIEALPRSVLFWRSFTHWIGGMGVLVFTLAVLPKSNERTLRLMHVMRAEVPGPSVGKFVSRVKSTARILYGIYIVLTVLEILLLWAGRMPLFDAVCNAFGTAGTGGFGLWNDSIAYYHNPYAEWVMGVFMVLFSLNFNLFYLLLLRQFKLVLKNSELRWFLSIVLVATGVIAYDTRAFGGSLGETIRQAFFQVTSIVSTSGFTTTDFDRWPVLSKTILVLLMFIGACAGSTGGGLKVGRIILLTKTFFREIQHMLHPRSVTAIRIDGKRVDEEVMRGASSFIITYIFVFAASVLLIAVFNEFDLVSNFTAVSACINNVGPGLGVVGPTGNYAAFSDPSKLVLTFDMLAGRLELFPMLMVFSPSVWRNH